MSQVYNRDISFFLLHLGGGVAILKPIESATAHSDSPRVVLGGCHFKTHSATAHPDSPYKKWQLNSNAFSPFLHGLDLIIHTFPISFKSGPSLPMNDLPLGSTTNPSCPGWGRKNWCERATLMYIMYNIITWFSDDRYHKSYILTLIAPLTNTASW